MSTATTQAEATGNDTGGGAGEKGSGKDSSQSTSAKPVSMVTTKSAITSTIAVTTAVRDCKGVLGGNVTIDQCGVCGGDNSTCTGCMDSTACNFALKFTIDGGDCIFPQYPLDCNKRCVVKIDCFDVCDGPSREDSCGVCDGDGSSCTTTQATTTRKKTTTTITTAVTVVTTTTVPAKTTKQIGFVANVSFALVYGLDPEEPDVIDTLEEKVKEKVLADLENSEIDTSDIDVDVQILRDPETNEFIVNVTLAAPVGSPDLDTIATLTLLSLPVVTVENDSAANVAKIDLSQNDDSTMLTAIIAAIVAALLLCCLLLLLLLCCYLRRPKIYVRLQSGDIIVVPISLKKNVRALKENIFKKASIPIDSQTVLFSGENKRKQKKNKTVSGELPEITLYDDHTLAQSGLVNQSIVNLRSEFDDKHTGNHNNYKRKPWLKATKNNKVFPNAVGSTADNRPGSDDIYDNNAPSKVAREATKKSSWKPRAGAARVVPYPASPGARMHREDDSKSQNLPQPSQNRQNSSQIATMGAPRVQRIDDDNAEWAPRHSRRDRSNKPSFVVNNDVDERNTDDMTAPSIQREGSAKSDWAPYRRRSQRPSRNPNAFQAVHSLARIKSQKRQMNRVSTATVVGPATRRRSARRRKGGSAKAFVGNEQLEVKKISLGRKRRQSDRQHEAASQSLAGVAREAEQNTDWKPVARPSSSRSVSNTGDSSSSQVADPSFTSVNREEDVVSQWKPAARRSRRSVAQRSGDSPAQQTGDADFSSVRREDSIKSNWKPTAQKRIGSASSMNAAALALEEIVENDHEIVVMDAELHEV